MSPDVIIRAEDHKKIPRRNLRFAAAFGNSLWGGSLWGDYTAIAVAGPPQPLAPVQPFAAARTQ